MCKKMKKMLQQSCRLLQGYCSTHLGLFCFWHMKQHLKLPPNAAELVATFVHRGLIGGLASMPQPGSVTATQQRQQCNYTRISRINLMHILFSVIGRTRIPFHLAVSVWFWLDYGRTFGEKISIAYGRRNISMIVMITAVRSPRKKWAQIQCYLVR